MLALLLLLAATAAALDARAPAAPAPARTAVHAGARAPAKPALPFIADDYARAVAEARARRVPLFVESWAPW